MPYANVPAHLTKKMDDCRTQVAKANPSWSESRVIATCHKSVVGKKDMGSDPAIYYPYDGATSFEEIDAWLKAQEVESAVEHLTWQLETLIRNIMDLSTDKVSKLTSVVAELGKRSKDPMKFKSLATALLDTFFKTDLSSNPVLPEYESGMTIQKDLSGSYRWFGWVSNKWRDIDAASDRKHRGELITSKAHQEYVSWLDVHPGLAPESWSWHTPGTARKSKVDWWDFADGFLVMSGPLTDDEADAMTKTKESGEEIGMSHLFFFEKDEEHGWITKYRTLEVSDLPVKWAGNPWTGLSVLQSTEAKSMSFTTEKREYLVKVLGEERVRQLEADTEGRSKALTQLGIDAKSLGWEEPVVEESKTTPTTEPPATETSATETLAVTSVPISPEVIELQEGVKSLVTVVQQLLTEGQATAKSLKELETKVTKTDDERVAELLAPRLTSSVMALLQQKSVDAQPDGETEEPKGPKLPEESKSWVKNAIPPINVGVR